MYSDIFALHLDMTEKVCHSLVFMYVKTTTAMPYYMAILGLKMRGAIQLTIQSIIKAHKCNGFSLVLVFFWKPPSRY